MKTGTVELIATLLVRLKNGRDLNVPVLAGQTVRVGRSASNDLVLEDSKVSRFHAAFSASKSGVVVSDLSSLNGTSVNGRRVTTPQSVIGGDTIEIGDALIVVGMHADGPSPADSAIMTQAASMQPVTITVMLADVCSFTRMSAAVPSQDMSSMLHCWFDASSEVVRKEGGEVDKYIGDCVMAIFRGPHKEAAAKAKAAARAGLQILQVTRRLNESWPHNELYPWTCRIALNSGEALMGAVAAGGKREYTVVGDSVNVAFKIEEAANATGKDFVMSSDTACLLRPEFEAEVVGTAAIDGRAERVPVFSLVQKT
jgi:adenylate cyclase